jgi:hypothetical protein
MSKLKDERIAYIITANETAYVEPESLAMALEIQERRAADLTPEERDLVTAAVQELRDNWDEDWAAPVIRALEKVIGTKQ